MRPRPCVLFCFEFLLFVLVFLLFFSLLSVWSPIFRTTFQRSFFLWFGFICAYCLQCCFFHKISTLFSFRFNKQNFSIVYWKRHHRTQNDVHTLNLSLFLRIYYKDDDDYYCYYHYILFTIFRTMCMCWSELQEARCSVLVWECVTFRRAQQ